MRLFLAWSRTNTLFLNRSLKMRKAALRAETDASLAKQAAVSKKQATRREAIAVEEQQKIENEALEHQAEIEAETRVEEGTTTAPWDTIIVKLHWLHQW